MNVAHRLSYASSSWKSLCGTIRSSRIGSSHVHLRWYSSHVVKNGRPFRMAVIGSGPAAFYTAKQVMSKIETATVDMFEKLPVPFGLVRFGVAPDHPEVKVSLPRASSLMELVRKRSFLLTFHSELSRQIQRRGFLAKLQFHW